MSSDPGDAAPDRKSIVVEGMRMDEYLADPAPQPSLQSSIVQQLLQTAPAAVFAENRRLNPDFIEEQADSAQRNARDFGTAAHSTFVEGDDSAIRFVKANDWRSGAAKQARAEADAHGMVAILEGKRDALAEMAVRCDAACRRNTDIGHLFRDRALFESELTLLWEEAGVWHRARPDLAARDRSVLIHYKTTRASIHPPALPRLAGNMNWDVTAAHYEAAGRYCFGVEDIEQYFVVQSVVPPYLVVIAALDELFMETGQMQRRQAIPLWRHCLETGRWPAYPPATLMLTAPAYHETNAVAARDVMRTDPTTAQIEAGKDFHRPD